MTKLPSLAQGVFKKLSYSMRFFQCSYQQKQMRVVLKLHVSSNGPQISQMIQVL